MSLSLDPPPQRMIQPSTSGDKAKKADVIRYQTAQTDLEKYLYWPGWDCTCHPDNTHTWFISATPHTSSTLLTRQSAPQHERPLLISFTSSQILCQVQPSLSPKDSSSFYSSPWLLFKCIQHHLSPGSLGNPPTALLASALAPNHPFFLYVSPFLACPNPGPWPFLLPSDCAHLAFAWAIPLHRNASQGLELSLHPGVSQTTFSCDPIYPALHNS